MKWKYDNCAYCGHCQRWISKIALASNSLGAQICPYCHGRVRVKRHPHDLPKEPCLTFEEVAENSKTVQESNESVQKYSNEDNITACAEGRKNTLGIYSVRRKKFLSSPQNK